VFAGFDQVVRQVRLFRRNVLDADIDVTIGDWLGAVPAVDQLLGGYGPHEALAGEIPRRSHALAVEIRTEILPAQARIDS
jgi:hypothetical protein